MNLNVNGKPPEKDPEDLRCQKPTPMMLLNEISHLMGERIHNEHDELFAQRSIRLLIMELAYRDGRTQLDLVNATHLKAPTVSVTMQKLEKEGIVIRRPDEYDQRATRVFLTEKGRELDNRTRKSIHQAEENAMSELTDDDRAMLFRLLLKVRDTLIADQTSREKEHRKDGKKF